MAPKKLDMHPVFLKLGTYTHSLDIFRSPDSPQFDKCRSVYQTGNRRQRCNARCRAAKDDDDNDDSGGAQTSAMVALWQHLTTLAVVMDKAQLYDDVVAFTELTYCGKHRGRKTLVNGLARWKADLDELEAVEGSEAGGEFEDVEDVEDVEEEEEDVDFPTSTSDDTVITVFSETHAADMPSFCTMSDAESDNGSIVLVEDGIYKESATPEPDTCATDAELGDDDVFAPAASTAFITAATFSADDDDASEEDYVDAPDMAVPLVAESETCAADAVHAVEKVAEVISAPTASAPFTTEAALCASDVADSIVVKEATRASPAVSVPLVAGTEVWVADAGHTAAAAAEIIPVPMAYTPAIADPELSAFDAADSIAMKKDNLVALEVAASPITLGRQDVSGPVDADQGSPLALVKLVAAKSVFSQDIQHCDPGMQLPMHANNSDPLDKSRDAKACFERQDKPENHHEASAESNRATHMMNQSSLLGTAAITPPPVEASEERDELYEMFVDKDDIANHDKVDVCAEQRIISAQSTQPLQEGMTVPAERASTPPETRTACVASDDTSVQLGNSTPSLCDDGCIAVQSALQLDGLDAGNIVVSDNLPLVPASSTTAEDMRSNDRQSTWTPSQLPTVVVRKPTPQESSPAVMILDDNELLQRASDKEVRPSLAESADSLFGGSSSREDGTPLLRGTSTDSITFDVILPHQTSDASVDTSNATKKPLGVKLGELTRTLVELAPRRPRQLLRKQLSDARLGYRGGDDSSKSGARG